MGELVINSYEVKSGKKWRYRIEVGSQNGKRKYIGQRGFLTKKDALLAGTKAYEEFMHSGVSYKSNISYSDFLDKWLEDDVAKRCKEATVVSYRKKIKNIIKPKLGMYLLKDIKRQRLVSFLSELYDEGYSINTINGTKGILTASFRYAVNTETIPFSPAADLDSVKKISRPPRKQTRSHPNVYICKEDMNKILERFPEGNPAHLPLMIAYHCGLRLGEVYALTWDDIDFDNRTLSVNRQVQWSQDTGKTENEKILSNGNKEQGNGYWYFSEPKFRSYRIISIDNQLLELLQRTKKRNEICKIYTGPSYTQYYGNNELYFTGKKPDIILQNTNISTRKTEYEINFINVREDGTFISPRTKMHMSTVIKNNIGIEDFTFHSLRHTHATDLRDMGCPEAYIQNRLGHAKIDTTINIYTNHFTSELKKQGDSYINSLYG